MHKAVGWALAAVIAVAAIPLPGLADTLHIAYTSDIRATLGLCG